ncbi:MAG TPA: glycosyltransferase family 4 protein [Paucimonas sp.]|nr:glycosyltransferase family 4 protein [Paucimonas sp.]
MTSMRILLVSEDIPYPNMGGLAKHVLNLARALVRAGHEVDLLGGDQHPLAVAGEEGEFGGRFFGELSGHTAGWKEIRFGMFMPPRRSWLARRFARIILRRAPGYDVIHYHGHVPNVARYIPTGVNFVQTRHDHGSECIMRTRFRDGAVCASVDPADCARCRTACPNALQRAVSAVAVIRFRREVADGFGRHKTIFVSEMLRRNFARALGPGPWGEVLHNFIDVVRLEQVRAAVRPPTDGGFHVFIAAKLYPEKGVEAFLRELSPRMPENMRLTIAGDGGDERKLRAAFVDRRIRFLGWCSPERTLELAAGAHAIVVPSIWEDPCPSTIFEGLLLGKPTFALARGGTPELAMYASSPQQLRLHDDMPSLVRDLIGFAPETAFAPPDGALGSADHAVRRLLEIYARPPGRLIA